MLTLNIVFHQTFSSNAWTYIPHITVYSTTGGTEFLLMAGKNRGSENRNVILDSAFSDTFTVVFPVCVYKVWV